MTFHDMAYRWVELMLDCLMLVISTALGTMILWLPVVLWLVFRRKK